MSALRIYLDSTWRDANSACAWALLGDAGNLLQSGTAAFAAMPKGHDVEIIVAADRVLIVEVALPAGGRKRWQKALPYLVEEFTLSDPEENHVVPGPDLADARKVLFVLDKSWLKRVTEAARIAGLSLRLMAVETLLAPLEAGSWTLVRDAHGGFVRTALHAGTALDLTEQLPLALRLSLEQAPQLPKKIHLAYAREVPVEQRSQPQWSELQIPLAAASDWDWRRVTIPSDATNLLWGEFAPRAKIRAWWPKLRPAVWLLLAVLALEIAGSNLQWALLASEKNRVNNAMQKTFRATFGENVTLVNAPLQMRRNLAEMRHVAGIADDGDYLPLLNQASRALSMLPAGSVIGMHYEAGRLDVLVRLLRKGDFAVLQQALHNSGLALRMGETKDLGNAVEAKLSLAPEGGL